MTTYRDFSLSHDGTTWVLAWTAVADDGATRAVTKAIDCDVAPAGDTFSRGDCMGEIDTHLPFDVRARFTRLTAGLVYPVALAQINGLLAQLP